MRKKIIGKCKICGETKILTKEHIPPRSTLNNGTLKVYKGDELLKTLHKDRKPWELEGLKYELVQGGYTVQTLCAKCNSYTGSNYGNFYKRAADTVVKILQQEKLDDVAILKFTIFKFKQLNFIKQVLSMFASMTAISDYDEIKELLLDKNKTGLELSKIRIFINLYKSGMLRKSGIVAYNKAGITYLLCELVAPPFVFNLLLNADEIGDVDCSFLGVDFTKFINEDYDKEIDTCFSLPFVETNQFLPAIYLTRDEILNRSNKP